MNARLGKKDARFDKKGVRCFVYNDVTNENGKRQLDFMQECRTEALNTGYRKRKNYGHIHYRVARNHRLITS